MTIIFLKYCIFFLPIWQKTFARTSVHSPASITANFILTSTAATCLLNDEKNYVKKVSLRYIFNKFMIKKSNILLSVWLLFFIDSTVFCLHLYTTNILFSLNILLFCWFTFLKIKPLTFYNIST